MRTLTGCRSDDWDWYLSKESQHASLGGKEVDKSLEGLLAMPEGWLLLQARSVQ